MFGATQDPVPDMRLVALTVQGPAGDVPAVGWLPAESTGPRPVVLVGHGAGGHKAAPIVARTAGLVTALGLAALSIDCPYHGDRTPPDEVGLTAAQRRERLGLDGWRERNAEAVTLAVADWRAALDAVQALDEVGTGPAGYLGLSLGARFGLPLIAAENRIAAAVLGLFGATEAGPVAEAARQITVPVLFLLQWDDELYPRDGGLRLFDMLGSADKTLHASPGRHLEFPPAELAEAARFLGRQLTP
jgi:dienelactone hydrolase